MTEASPGTTETRRGVTSTMARRPTPTLRRKELGARLKKLRQARDLTAEQVAEQLMVSATKISRLETGTRGVNPRDIRDLCTIYGVGDEERERLMTLAKQSRESSWWQQYDSEYSTWLATTGARPGQADCQVAAWAVCQPE